MLARPEWTTTTMERRQPGPMLLAVAAVAAFVLLVLGDVYVIWAVLRAW